MSEILRRLLIDSASQGLVWGIGLVYLVVFQIAVADLTIDGVYRPTSTFVVPNWESLILRERAPFQFEAVAILDAPSVVWLISPMNIAIGMTLGLLTGFQIAVVRIARRCAVACGLSPATGVLAGLPGLLAGRACCAPILFVLLGVQVTASLVTLMGLMIPAAFVFLVAGLALTLRVAARRCSGAHADPAGEAHICGLRWQLPERAASDGRSVEVATLSLEHGTVSSTIRESVSTIADRPQAARGEQ